MDPFVPLFVLLMWGFGGLIFLAQRQAKMGKVVSSEDSKLLVSILTAFVLVVLSPLYCEFPVGATGKVVTFENEKVVVHEHGVFVWEWGQFSNLSVSSPLIYDYKKRQAITGEVNIITDNPKTRNFKYEVYYHVEKPAVYYSKDYRRQLKSSLDVESDIARTIQYYFYEFNDKNSRELAKFYNPLDPKQQLEFHAFFSNWLNAQLGADGILITHAEFSF